jgi:DNA polymerase/3'-5' exonuclease PolX
MQYIQAKQMADSLIERLQPACERIEFSGALRRKESEVDEINLLALPRLETEIIFEARATRKDTRVDKLLGTLEETGIINYGKEATTPKQAWFNSKAPPTNKRFWLADPAIAVQLYLVLPPASWGVRHLFGSGTDDYRHWLVTRKKLGGALPDHCRVKDGAVWDRKTGEKYDTPEEIDFFHLCGLEWKEPESRVALWSR